MNTDNEIIWAAGFYDGEGSTCAPPPRSGCINHHLFMSVTQVDKRPLLRFMEAVGEGTIFELKRRTKTQNIAYRWQVSRNQAERVAVKLYPYLSEPKREQIDRARQRIKDNYKEPMSMKDRSALAVKARRG